MKNTIKIVNTALVTWIGFTDLGAFGSTLSNPEQEKLRKHHEGLADRHFRSQLGPARACIEHSNFDEVHVLLWGPLEKWHEQGIDSGLLAWLAEGTDTNIISHVVDLDQPMNWEKTFKAVKEVLAKVTDVPDLWMNLSSGALAMQAAQLLLGKSRLPIASKFLTTYAKSGGMPEVTEVYKEFDLRVDYLPAASGLKIDSQMALYDAGLSNNPDTFTEFAHIIGESDAIKRVKGIAAAAAKHECNVLLLGETGVGKEMFARAIHSAGNRCNETFVALNCGDFDDQLLRSELFGHEKGAFTDARASKDGLLHSADKGTLFLDEFGECSDTLQKRLLRVLNPEHGDPITTRRYRKLGGEDECVSDVRIILATNQDLISMRREGKLREDLYQRIAEMPINIPPLRDRESDVLLIAEDILKRFGENSKLLDNDSRQIICRESWRGNVRALRNKLLQASIYSVGDYISPDALEEVLAADHITHDISELLDVRFDDGFDINQYIEKVEQSIFEMALKRSNNNKTKAAKLVGLSQQTFSNRLKTLK